MIGILLFLSLAVLVLIAPGLRGAFDRGVSAKPAGHGANAIDTQPSNYNYGS